MGGRPTWSSDDIFGGRGNKNHPHTLSHFPSGGIHPFGFWPRCKTDCWILTVAGTNPQHIIGWVGRASSDHPVFFSPSSGCHLIHCYSFDFFLWRLQPLPKTGQPTPSSLLRYRSLSSRRTFKRGCDREQRRARWAPNGQPSVIIRYASNLNSPDCSLRSTGRCPPVRPLHGRGRSGWTTSLAIGWLLASQ